MKTQTLEAPFDAALAGQKLEGLRTRIDKLSSNIESKIQEGIQSLLQIILRNVTLNKGNEIVLDLYNEKFLLHCYYDKKNNYGHTVEFSFVRKHDTYRFNGDEKDKPKVGDISKVTFSGLGYKFHNNECVIDNSDCLSLYVFLSNDLKNNGEFLTEFKSIYSQLREMWDEQDKLWSEGRELNNEIEKSKKSDYEKQIRSKINNYFIEGNFIVIRKIKKDFIEASVMEIGKVQKTTFYGRHHNIEIGSVFHVKDKYAPKVESYRHEMKRHSIDTYISIWADDLNDGDKIEILSTESWNKLKSEIDKEYRLIQNGKLGEKSEMYHKVKYRKEDN